MTDQSLNKLKLTINPLDRNAYKINLADVRENVKIAYIREGIGGVPLLMICGYPGTKRIFYKNIEPLAAAGFEVIVPDHSGWGDSPQTDRLPDFTGTANYFKELMEQLGHDRWVVAAFDFGSVTAMHMVNRFPEKIIRQVIWNGMVPLLPDEYERAGLSRGSMESNAEVSTHLDDMGRDTDEFAKRFETDEQRLAQIGNAYREHVWSPGQEPRSLVAPGSFDEESIAFHCEPFADAVRFRASMNYYGALMHPELCYEPPLLAQKTEVETMFLYGMEDQLCGGAGLTRMAEIAYPNLVGPFHVTDGGHFLSWERPTVINGAITSFCRDLLA